MDKIKNTLSETATLVRVTLGHPSGIKSDRHLKNGLAEDVNSQADLLNVSKHIYGKNINKEFRKIINAFRNDYYYRLSLPWGDSFTDDDASKGVMASGGWRLLPNTNYDQLIDCFNEAKAQFQKDVDYFFKQLETNMKQAKLNLGDAFKEADYPTMDWELVELRKKFIFDIQLGAVPTVGNSSDIRINASEGLKKRIENDVSNRLTQNIKNVLILTVDSLVGQVEHLAEKLREYDPENKQKGFFNNSSIAKLKELVETLPNTNSDILGNDAEISKAHQKLVGVLAQINSVDSLRDESEIGESKRKKVADDLSDAVSGLKGGFLGKAFGGSKND